MVAYIVDARGLTLCRPRSKRPMTDDLVFHALGDANRRRLIDRLHAQDGQSLRALGDGLAMTRQAVAKHLACLQRAGLVHSVRAGRERHYFLDAAAMHQVAVGWVRKFEHPRPPPVPVIGETERPGV